MTTKELRSHSTPKRESTREKRIELLSKERYPLQMIESNSQSQLSSHSCITPSRLNSQKATIETQLSQFTESHINLTPLRRATRHNRYSGTPHKPISALKLVQSQSYSNLSPSRPTSSQRKIPSTSDQTNQWDSSQKKQEGTFEAN